MQLGRKALALALVLLGLLNLMPGTSVAQQSGAEREERQTSAPEQLGERSPEQRPVVLQQLQEMRGARKAHSTLEPADANLFMRSAAGLTGVGWGSSSSVADVNEDGHLDLLIAGRNPNGGPSTTLYLGSGDGSFTTAEVDLAGVSIYSSTSITDVDGDGHLDLFINGEDERNADVAKLYWGQGDGTFAESNVDLDGGEGGSHSIADVNGDGHQDILITGRESEGYKTTLYLGNGDRTFSDAGADLPEADFGSTAIVDFNNDEHSDLLVTGSDRNANRIATLYLGRGDGTFTEANAGLTGVSGSSTSIADVNEDGNLDLLLTGYDGSAPIATLYIGRGDGTFSEADAGLTGVSWGSTSIADVDSDGQLDLLITGTDDLFGASARIYVNRTRQTGPNRPPRFTRPFNYNAARLAAGLPLTRYVEAGDPDGDRLSIRKTEGPSNAALTDAGNGVAEVTLAPDRNQGGRTVALRIEARDAEGATASVSTSVEVSSVMAALPVDLTGVRESSAETADVNEDGIIDLLITGRASGGDPTATLYLGNGDGTFTEAEADLTGVTDGSTSIADVDSDGHLDLLITGWDGNAPTATLYLGRGDGTFTEASANLTGVAYSSSSIADVNGDERPDLLITGDPDPESFTEPIATLYLGNGDGTFAEVDAGLNGVFDGSSSIADVNGDGHPDLLVAGNPRSGIEQGVALYLGNGDGTFAEADAGLNEVYEASTSIADVNEDGASDLLIAGDGTATLYLGNGDGTFTEANASLVGVSRGTTSIADVNGDEHPDLLITGSGRATLYLGNGDGSFAEANAGLAGVERGAAALGDVDGDGDPDLLISGISLLTGGPRATRSSSTILYENLYDAPLAVAMTRFDAALRDGVVRLTWAPPSGVHYTEFLVQRRSENGEPWGEGAWQTVGRVEGAGPGESQTYQFADTPSYKTDTLTYRLKLVKTEGLASYSAPVTLDRGGAETQLLAPYPNPTRGRVTVRYAVPGRWTVRLDLYDALGRRVRTVINEQQRGRHARQVDLSGLASGVYFLRLRAGNTTRTQKVTVVR